MTRIGICDDSIELSKRIAEIVAEAFLSLGVVCEIESFTDGGALIERNLAAPFDVLFLDIDMPVISGFDIAKTLRDGFSDCLIVFVTSHPELVFDSLDFQPFNFVRKDSGQPLAESIPKVVGKLAFQLRQDETLLIEDVGQKKTPVRIRDIICVESVGHYLRYSVFENGLVRNVKSRGGLSERQEFFENRDFVRAHKGFLVNMSQIRYFSSSRREIELNGGITVPIGKLYKSSVEERYSVFLRRRS